MTPLLISSMTAISIFMFVFFVVIIKGKSKTLKGKWLFDNFFVNLTESFIIIIAFLLASPLVGILGFLTALLIFIYLPMKADSEAKKRKKQLERELPRFLDLLKTALQINLPIDQAIDLTAKHLDGPLSDELLASLAETKIGTSNWQNALQKLARQYEIDDLSDFIMDITVAYDKGIPIYDIVAKKASSLKQTRLLSAKEKAARLTSTIVVPMFLFKIIPLLDTKPRRYLL